jgi:glycosyltransferase involved in cell wall biosynthesis
MTAVDLLLPGDIETLTGGYIYDRRIFAGLATMGWRVRIHSLADRFPEPPPDALVEASAVLAAIPDGRIVVIDGLAFAGLRNLLPAHRARLKFVALIHHPLAYETGLEAEDAQRLHAVERAALATGDRVIVTSHWTKGALLEDFGVGAERIAVVEPGTDPAPLRQPVAGAPPELLCVASLTERKGHTVLIDALARLRDQRWHLTCAGSLTRDAALVDRLRKQIEQRKLGERITLIGELAPEALGEYYARADLFVLASYMEGYGMAFAEALARGVPIVATTGGAIADTVPAAASRLVAPGDPAALASALAELLADRTTLADLGRAAAEFRHGLSTWQTASERFADALEAPSR